tara:strand:- start:143 stop:343 length:201 start_codon:yes stop_codon:yes gene_type:complete
VVVEQLRLQQVQEETQDQIQYSQQLHLLVVELVVIHVNQVALVDQVVEQEHLALVQLTLVQVIHLQ